MNTIEIALQKPMYDQAAVKCAVPTVTTYFDASIETLYF